MLIESPPPEEKRINLTDTFHFSCHKDLSCFNKCCRNKHLPLTPYDALRLKKALGIHSDEFISQYTVYRIEKHCPFSTPQGCKVYNHRPTACRLFPLARISGKSSVHFNKEEFYYLLDIPGCLGFGQDWVWTVGQWRNDQDLNPYIEINDGMVEVVLNTNRNQRTALNEKQLQKVIVACYNLDVFREFVFKTAFLEHYEVDEETRLKIRHDDTALLKLGFAYLKRSLFP